MLNKIGVDDGLGLSFNRSKAVAPGPDVTPAFTAGRWSTGLKNFPRILSSGSA